jgi:hypothetical protein
MIFFSFPQDIEQLQYLERILFAGTRQSFTSKKKIYIALENNQID